MAKLLIPLLGMMYLFQKRYNFTAGTFSTGKEEIIVTLNQDNFFNISLKTHFWLISGVLIPSFKVGAAFGRIVGEALHVCFPDGVRYGAQVPLPFRKFAIVKGSFAVGRWGAGGGTRPA